MGKRDPYYVERDLKRYRRKYQIFPALESIPDLSRYEIRLAAEVVLTMAGNSFVPVNQALAFEIARIKAFGVLKILAKG